MRSAVHQPLPVPSLDLTPARHAARSVVMVTSPGSEPTRAAVAVNLASVCAEIGQRVVIVTTDDIEAHVDERELPRILAPLTDDERDRRLTGPLRPDDVQDRLEDTSVPGVSFLALQHFVAHTSQVVIRIPEVLDALRDVVDVVILDVPSFLSVHHGQGLAPLADLVLIVGERRLTTTDELRRTSAVLRRLGAPVVGMALTTGTGAPVRDDDEEWDDDEDDDRPRADRGRRRARKRPNDEADDDGAMNGHGVSPADATTVTDAKPFVADLVEQTPLSLTTPSEPRAVWDVPPRPEA
jgi:Mrp family chromosome partitioning ATPase